jgi:hypothetical protein
VTRAERTLLLAVFRWARTEGGMQWGRWHYRWTRQSGPREQWLGIDFDREDGEYLSIYRGRASGRDYWVADIAEAVDVLAALGILPLRFSTAYRAGYDACMRAHRIAESRMPDRPLFSRGWTDPEVYALLPWADHELAVRR